MDLYAIISQTLLVASQYGVTDSKNITCKDFGRNLWPVEGIWIWKIIRKATYFTGFYYLEAYFYLKKDGVFRIILRI